jgi:hypothetical protein
MAETITFDQIVSGTLQIMRESGENAKVIATYIVVDARRTGQRDRTRILSLTPAEQTMINNIWDAAVAKVRTAEGL